MAGHSISFSLWTPGQTGPTIEIVKLHMNVFRDVYRVQISKRVVEPDNALATYIRDTFVLHQYPWRRRNAA